MRFAIFLVLLILAVSSVTAFGQEPANEQRNGRSSDWGGAYAGLNVGYANTDLRIASIGQSSAINRVGPFGGVQAGYNWQLGSLVFGIEADIQLSGQSKNFYFADRFSSTTQNDAIKFFSTIRGRLGYAFSHWLLFATGGWGYIEATERVMFRTFGIVTGDQSLIVPRNAWVAGGGLELKLDKHWSVKTEYLHIDTGVFDGVAYGLPYFGAREKTNLGRLGLNYYF
jgi:outer membrane immunogenic protein